MKTYSFIYFAVLVSVNCFAQGFTTPDSAKYFEGKHMVICGKVAGANTLKSGMTFFNFGNPYPDQSFTAVVNKKDSAVLQNNPPSFYKNKSICVKGKIVLYKGKPEMFLESPGNIWIDEEEK